jgi:hypothetical protein
MRRATNETPSVNLAKLAHYAAAAGPSAAVKGQMKGAGEVGGGWGPGGEDRLPPRLWRASGTTSEAPAREAMI